MRKFVSGVDGDFRGLFGTRHIETGPCIELVGEVSLPGLSEVISGCRHGDECGCGEAGGEMRANEI